MPTQYAEYIEYLGGSKLTSTLILFLLMVLVRAVARNRIAEMHKDDPVARLRWQATLRYALIGVFGTGIALVWAQQLQAFAVSVFALAAAIVIATKELILCISGSVIRTASRAFAIGDRIEVNGLRGDVVDVRLLSTTILEIGPGTSSHQHTGRSITIPNSVFVGAPVVNETYSSHYVLHIFTVPVAADSNWSETERMLLEAARAECGTYLEEARAHINDKPGRARFEERSIEPRVVLQIADPNRINLLIRIPAPAREKGRIEQAILRRYFNERARAAGQQVSESKPGKG